MRIRFDWPQIYAALVSQSARPAKNAFTAARRMENDIFDEGRPAGEVFGDQTELLHRYGFSRATLREAVRLLEDRNVARMRRGPGGGLIVLPLSCADIAPAVADYFHAAGVTAEQVQQARAALDIVVAYRQCAGGGPEDLGAFTKHFRGLLAEAPGAGLLCPRAKVFRSATRATSGHPFTDLFLKCLDEIEDRMARTGPGDCEPSQSWTKRGRAHELAHTLALELRHARAGDRERLSTEDQLCERYDVSREVLRQAIRVLESRGLIDCRRGRTHGLHVGTMEAGALVELVVRYFSSRKLCLSEHDPVAAILSRIVRMVVAAESTTVQRQRLLRQLECIYDWHGATSLITVQLHSEWAIAANPILIFMDQCATAYYARVCAPVWTFFDDSELPPLQQLQHYMDAVARGDLVRADRLVEEVCARICALRKVDAPTSVQKGRVFW